VADDLFSWADTPRVGRLEAEWQDYHADHPEVYRLICRYAETAIQAGRKRYALATIWELIRWHYQIEQGMEEFALPNNHRAYYARLWLIQHPEHPRFFQTCELRSETGSPTDRWGRTEADLVAT